MGTDKLYRLATGCAYLQFHKRHRTSNFWLRPRSGPFSLGLPQVRTPPVSPAFYGLEQYPVSALCPMMVEPWCEQRRAIVATGTVKWFNPTKGYGFIQPQSGGKDVFVHISAVERAGLSTLNEGAVVEYELVANKGKESAENIKVK